MRDLKVVYGRRLRLFRKERNWTQSKLAEEADLSLDMVGRLERGQAAPSFESMARISTVLGVAPARFFTSQNGSGEGGGEQDVLMDRIAGRLSGLSANDLRRIERILNAVLS